MSTWISEFLYLAEYPITCLRKIKDSQEDIKKGVQKDIQKYIATGFFLPHPLAPTPEPPLLGLDSLSGTRSRALTHGEIIDANITDQDRPLPRGRVEANSLHAVGIEALRTIIRRATYLFNPMISGAHEEGVMGKSGTEETPTNPAYLGL